MHPCNTSFLVYWLLSYSTYSGAHTWRRCNSMQARRFFIHACSSMNWRSYICDSFVSICELRFMSMNKIIHATATCHPLYLCQLCKIVQGTRTLCGHHSQSIQLYLSSTWQCLDLKTYIQTEHVRMQFDYVLRLLILFYVR